MSLKSNHPGILDRHTTETTDPHETEPNPIDAAIGEQSRRGETGDAHPVSGTRTGIVSLKAKVKLLEAEREALATQVLALEADVAELEEEVATLEGTVEAEEQHRQQVIDKYEHVIAAMEAENRELREESEATPNEDTIRRWPLPAVASSVETVCARLKDLVPNG